MKFILSLLSFALINNAFAAGMNGIADAASIVRNADGSYSVVCKDGTKEQATLEQVNKGDVCNGNTPIPSLENVEAIYSITADQFHVLCIDGSWEYANVEQVRTGQICKLKKALLEPGVYAAPHTEMKVKYAGSDLYLEWPSERDQANGLYKCNHQTLICTQQSISSNYQIQIKSKNSFVFTYHGNLYTFVRQ